MSLTSRATRPLLILSLALALVACSTTAATPAPSPTPVVTAAATTAPPTAAPAFPISVTDDEGTAVEIATEPARIVSLTPATTEILFAIGAGDRVVATTDFDDYPPEAVDLPNVATYTSVDVEAIVGLEADLVIAGGNFFNDPDAIVRLRSLGMAVVVTYAPDIAGVLRDIELVGAAVGRLDAAKDLTAAMQAGFDQVAAATAGLPTPRTFYELDATGQIFTAADGSFIEEMIRLAGGDPITTGSTTVYSISIERLIAADPEVIVLGDAAYGVTAEAVAGRTGWNVMTAVRAGAIRSVNDLVVTRPGPRLVDGLRELALAIHPTVVLPAAPTAAP